MVGAPAPADKAANAAVNQLTGAMALAHAGDGIRANAVLPGYIDTPLVRQQLHGEIFHPEAPVKAISASAVLLTGLARGRGSAGTLAAVLAVHGRAHLRLRCLDGIDDFHELPVA